MSWLFRARLAAPWKADRNIVQNIVLAVIACAMAVASVAAAPGRAGWFGAALAFLMMAIAIVDAHRFIIPNELSLAAFLLAVANACGGGWRESLESIAMVLLRGATLGLAFFALREIYRRLRGREGIGLGDVKLAVVAGAWLDWPMMPIAVELAALAALAVYGVHQIIARHSLSATARLPFGLFLAPAIWLCWLLGARIFQS